MKRSVWMTWLLLSVFAVAAQAKDNVKFDGTLVKDPCSLSPDSSDIDVDFSSIADKYLYRYTRAPGQPFVIRLEGCDVSIGNSVMITFSGDEESELPGLLKVKDLSGIAIGIENKNGTLQPLNKSTPASALSNGDNDFNFSGYVQATPSALQNHTIGRGDFSAIATFEVSYP